MKGGFAVTNYNFRVYTNINRAMSNHNKIMIGPGFNTLDASILNLIKSFSDSNIKFYMSNKELGEIMVADPATVQRSVDRLLGAKLITKEITYCGHQKRRILTYQPEAVNKLLDLS